MNLPAPVSTSDMVALLTFMYAGPETFLEIGKYMLGDGMVVSTLKVASYLQMQKLCELCYDELTWRIPQQAGSILNWSHTQLEASHLAISLVEYRAISMSG